MVICHTLLKLQSLDSLTVPTASPCFNWSRCHRQIR